MQTTAGNIAVFTAIQNRLFKPVDNAALIVFRIIFGFLMCWHLVSILRDGTYYNNYIQPPFSFNYIGFDFLQPMPALWMYILIILMCVTAAMVMLGAWYRLAITAFSLAWTYLYLMQKSGYNNHYYLVLLLCWIMCLMPANRAFSVDVKRGAVKPENTCPQYCLWIFMAQMTIVYFFAAISKLDADWFSGRFIAIQFTRLSEHPVLGMVYGRKWFQLFICYAGFLFDLLIVPLLVWKRTRHLAFIVACGFHLFNSFTFRIGIFPYLSMALNMFFLDPALIRRLVFRVKQSTNYADASALVKNRHSGLITGMLTCYCCIQLLLPMRSWLFPGNVFWTEEGYRMSWKMMMRTKSGNIHFRVTDPVSGRIWIDEPGKSFSLAHMRTLATSPDIIWQYAQRLKRDFTLRGYSHVKVFAIGAVSLNRHPAKALVNPAIDLAAVTWEPFRHANWIMPY